MHAGCTIFFTMHPAWPSATACSACDDANALKSPDFIAGVGTVEYTVSAVLLNKP
jgi:hypothetical protein